MSEEVRMLKDLVERANVRLDVLAKFCQCSPASIKNYISGISLPNGTKAIGIRTGLQNYKELINEIIT